MYRPPVIPNDEPTPDHRTWRGILLSYGAMVAFVLALWAVSRPLAGLALFAILAGLAVGARSAVRALRCLHDRGGFTLDVGERVRITVARIGADGRC